MKPEPTIDGWPLWSGLPQRNLLKMRQAAWKDMRSEYKNDPECCFAMGFDAGYDAVARRVEPPVKESGEGFESSPASPVAYINVEKRTLEWATLIKWETPTTVKMDKVPLYTAPPKKEWVDLTDDEMLMIYAQPHEGFKYSLGRMIQAKLREKNS